MAVVCIISAGIAAGLTMGLLSLDVSKLEIKAMVGTPAEKEASKRLLPIVRNHHLLLVTLLLFNSLASESLPIFLGELMPNYVAVSVSVVCVFTFGEIIPTALFTGPNQLLIAASMYRIVHILMGFFYPIAYPISILLDYLFGNQEDIISGINRHDLQSLIHSQLMIAPHGIDTSTSTLPPPPPIMQTPNATSGMSTQPTNLLKHTEVALLSSILELAGCSIIEAMIPLSDVFMLSTDTLLTSE